MRWRAVLSSARRRLRMSDSLKILAGLAAGYLLGSFSTAIIVGKLYGKDITSLGSKSAGLTNTLRVLGRFAAVLVLAGDILKGVLACLVGLWLGVYAHVGAARDCVSPLGGRAGAHRGRHTR